MANQNFRVKNGLEVGGVEVVSSSGAVNTSSFAVSGVSAGTTGNTTAVPVITVNTRGIVTNVQSATISSLSDYTYTASNTTFILTTGSGTAFAQTLPSANTTVSGLIKVGDLLAVNSTGFASVSESSIDHDVLSGFVANEHIDHSSVSVTAGAGLSGGGTIAATRTIDVVAGDAIITNSTGVWVNNAALTIAGLADYGANKVVDHSTIYIKGGNGLSGNSNITANVTIGFTAGNSQLLTNSTGVWINSAAIDHDTLSGFVANEHIDHTGVTITAGDGLTGGGTIAATRTLAVDAGNGTVVNSTGVHVIGATGITSNATGIYADEGNIDIHNLSGYVADEHIAHSGVTITAGAGLTGGGTIAATRTLNIGAGVGTTVNADDVAVTPGDGVVANSTGTHVDAQTGLTANSTGLWTNDSQIVISALSGYDANEHVDHTAVSTTAGAGLTGGGTIAATRTLTVGAGDGISTNSTAVSVDAGNGLVSNSTGAHVVGGTGVVSNSTGVHIGQAIGTADAPTFADLVISGNLTVSGTQTTLNTTDLAVNDAIITVVSGLGSGVAPSLDAGIEVNRGSSANASLYWDESADRWTHKVTGGTEYVVHTKANDVVLGTDTSGNYIDDVTAGVGIAVTHTPGEGSDPSIAVLANTGIVSNSTGVFVNSSEVTHDSTSGFVANEHIDHTTVSTIAGTGLTGGGTIAADRTLNVIGGNGITANADDVAVDAQTGLTANSTGLWTNDSQIVHDSLSGFVANEHIDHSSVSVTAGNGLTGGGTIAATRTVAVGAGNGLSVNSTATAVLANTGITANSTGVFTNDSQIAHDSLSGFVANEHIDHSSVAITAGNGLTGGGTIAATRTVAVTGGTGVTSNSTGVHIGQAVGTTDAVTFADATISANTKVTTLLDGSNRTLKIYNAAGSVVWG
jgi:hypothetical protein